MEKSEFIEVFIFYKILSLPEGLRKWENIGRPFWSFLANLVRKYGPKTEYTVTAKGAVHGMCFTAERSLASVPRQNFLTVGVFRWRLCTCTS